MRKAILITATLTLLVSGCASKQEVVVTPAQQLYSNDELSVFNRLSKLDEKPKEPTATKYKEVQKEMLVSDPVYAKDNITSALIENKKNDEFETKPLFIEPLFTKVEIMPYETKGGIYHEQQSVWIKVKEGEIVMKINDQESVSDSFKHQMILGR